MSASCNGGHICRNMVRWKIFQVSLATIWTLLILVSIVSVLVSTTMMLTCLEGVTAQNLCPLKRTLTQGVSRSIVKQVDQLSSNKCIDCTTVVNINASSIKNVFQKTIHTKNPIPESNIKSGLQPQNKSKASMSSKIIPAKNTSVLVKKKSFTCFGDKKDPKPVKADFVRFTNLKGQDIEVINANKFAYSISSEMCKMRKPYLVTFAHSCVKCTGRRDTIRRTWGSVLSFKGRNLLTVFVVGQPAKLDDQTVLQEEASKHGDIVQGNFVDTYHNLTYKHVMGLRWVTTNCPTASYVLKSDDDTMHNPYRLIQMLNNHSLPEDSVYCRALNSPVHRHRSKWFVNCTEYPFSKYPTYCEGFAYILSRNTAVKLWQAAHMSRFFWIDDVYVTGFLREKANVTIINNRPNWGFVSFLSKDLNKLGVNRILYYREANPLSKQFGVLWEEIKNSSRKE